VSHFQQTVSGWFRITVLRDNVVYTCFVIQVSRLRTLITIC